MLRDRRRGRKGIYHFNPGKIATRVPAPILVDSTEADVVEEALKRIPGRAIINSINLEDGEKRTSLVLPMAKRYGAAVIALTIDEDGMALTADKKVAIAHRIHDLATKKYGLDSTDIIFDALTLPISTGQDEYRSAGIETLNAVAAHQEGACPTLRRFSGSATSHSASTLILVAC